jgi:phosphatidylserine decarboxylase
METAFRRRPPQMYIAFEGLPFIAIALMAAIVFLVFRLNAASVAFFLLACFVAFFFRNPERRPRCAVDEIVSPADGRIISVQEGVVSPYSGERSNLVSIFMSIFNVHINRSPIEATVKDVIYRRGSFLVASLDKASEKNERNAVVLEDGRGRKVVIVQIAGLIARRIICYLRGGEAVGRGERLGLIRFGSRVDMYLPECTEICVRRGDRVYGGESVIGRFL